MILNFLIRSILAVSSIQLIPLVIEKPVLSDAPSPKTMRLRGPPGVGFTPDSASSLGPLSETKTARSGRKIWGASSDNSRFFNPSQYIPDADGWVPVERPQRHPESFEEEEGVWVIFSKDLGGERFHVRLPCDPVYQHLPSGIQLDASADGDDLSLRVEKRIGEGNEGYFEGRLQEIGALAETFLVKAKKSDDGNTVDFFYSSSGKWVWERTILTQNFLYTFHTKSPEMTGESHRKFIRSLDIF